MSDVENVPVPENIPLSEKTDIAFTQDDSTEVMRWEKDGRLFWKEREVKTDEELRSMIRDLHGWFVSIAGADHG